MNASLVNPYRWMIRQAFPRLIDFVGETFVAFTVSCVAMAALLTVSFLYTVAAACARSGNRATKSRVAAMNFMNVFFIGIFILLLVRRVEQPFWIQKVFHLSPR